MRLWLAALANGGVVGWNGEELGGNSPSLKEMAAQT